MKEHIFKYLIDLGVWSLALPMAFYLRLDGQIQPYLADIALVMAVAIPLKAGVLSYMGLHKQSWHKIGTLDLFRIITGVILVSMLLLAGSLVTSTVTSTVFLPASVPLIGAALAVIMLSGTRLLRRIHHERRGKVAMNRSSRSVDRVLIAGAGDAGTMLAREISRHPESGMEIVGYLDDSPEKKRNWLLGYPVLGGLKEIGKVANKRAVDKVVIAMPTAPGYVVRRVVERAHAAGLKSQIMPGLYDLLSGRFQISQIRDVKVEDLLNRKQVELDVQPISEYLNDKTVLVTGAGGSIGSEIVRQIVAYNPGHVLLLGRGENSIYEIEREFRANYPDIFFTSLITNVQDRTSLEHHFRNFRPDVIFHAAAHKHVPLMEAHPDQAVLNNIGGTRNLAELALEYGVKRFVNISSDKSVNPTSVMGASKRVGEFVVERASMKAAKGQSFVSVRFGNVLGSRGSVVPLFKKQIKNGGPVTITDPEMTRYFMTIPEASQLVLQAGGLGENGSVYVLDMGQPVKIVDLANDLIRLSGLEPDEDIKINFTGARPGEKLFEELLTAEEGTTATHHSKIYTARSNGLPEWGFHDMLEELMELARRQDREGIRKQLKQMIPTYAYEPATKPLEKILEVA